MRDHVAPVMFAVALLLAPLAAEAQPAGKVYRVALILSTSPVAEMAGPEPVHPLIRAFLHGLRAHGYVEGRNLILERRSGEGHYERFGDIIAELVRLKADVIVTGTDALTRAAQAGTTTVPIVMAAAQDPVGMGFVQSLARPGGNITGLWGIVDPDIVGKGLELLKEAVPHAARVATLYSKDEKQGEGSPTWRVLHAAAQTLGIALVDVEFNPLRPTDAFTLITRARPDALFVAGSGPTYAHRGLILGFATRARLPSYFFVREGLELGGLMSYGVNVPDVYRRAATYVDKILKGTKPADLPVERPTKFDLVINMKTAKALGLTIPPSLLLRADEVIQ